MPSRPAFRERLRPAAWVWLAGAGLAGSIGLIFARLGSGQALVAVVVTGAAATTFLVRTTPSVTVQDGLLVAGPARIPLGQLGAAQVLDAAAMRHERGPGLDARAYLLIRGWIDTGVKVCVEDPADPTPYWLVSTRHPQALAAAVGAGRPRTGLP
jgi:Protein of unknown function (DUF3093)